ncbi:3-deoxy-7-phosphoheptulonate synthase [Finegoldia magna]|uniref:3-deoxy-7-phosphoheptulonate synthase n=1 Tax=Finegoldia magna TaxID=1260 RepID=UPI002889DEE2|nr:3-deoxy-7-phosphoheptulonate synthase [Finegoldia magna]
MIVKLKRNPNEKEVKKLINFLNEQNVRVDETVGDRYTIISLIGDTSSIDEKLISRFDIVDKVIRIEEPFSKANKKNHPQPKIVDVDGVKIGDGNFCVMAGPCSVESEEQIITIAKSVKENGANILRGGAFKPRSSPYAFQGLGKKGIDLLIQAKKETGLPIITEIMDLSDLDYFKDVDMLQVGARNMQNYSLLKELGRSDKPVLLKRGLCATYKEWIMSAEYIMTGGNENVVLCERGIRTFETYTRNTLDISAISVMKELSQLPIIMDPSHASGKYTLIEPLSLASTAAGCDGLMIEVHNDPENALSDGPQSVTCERFRTIMRKVRKLRQCIQ